MRRTHDRMPGGDRRRAAVSVVAVVLVVAIAPAVLLSDDLLTQVGYVGSLVAWLVVLLRRRHRPESPADAYQRALGESSAVHLHLGGVRVAAIHPRPSSPLVTLTWHSATTVLLDADGRQRGEIPRNALTSTYTLSVPVHDPVAVELLSGETGLGSVSVYGTIDLCRHPGGTLRDSGVVLDQVDLDFPLWAVSLPVEPELAA